jgi:hypothetical protein
MQTTHIPDPSKTEDPAALALCREHNLPPMSYSELRALWQALGRYLAGPR